MTDINFNFLQQSPFIIIYFQVFNLTHNVFRKNVVSFEHKANKTIVLSNYSINISTTDKEPMVKKEINFSIY